MHRRSDTLYEDAMIAAIALVHGLTVVTRNVKDFNGFGVARLIPSSTRGPESSESALIWATTAAGRGVQAGQWG
jgi:hypothetical protein